MPRNPPIRSRPERTFALRPRIAIRPELETITRPAYLAHEFLPDDTKHYIYVLRCGCGSERRPRSADDVFRSRIGATSFYRSPRLFRNYSPHRGGKALTATVVLGLAWGDEGKGRVCDALASDVDYVSRYSGGNNAGHTVRVGEEEFKVHLVPSGIVREGVVCTIGNGVVVNPEVLVEEVEALEKRGLEVRDRLKVDGRSHLIMPYHIALDSHREIALGDARIGTTNRGIGPAYEDKVARYGIRVQDIFDEGILKTKLKAALREKNAIFENVYGEEHYDVAEVASWLLSFREFIGPMVADTGTLLREALDNRERVLLEGGQATLLDNDHGTYPFVTSSNPTVGGAVVGSGIPARHLEYVVGVPRPTRRGSATDRCPPSYS